MDLDLTFFFQLGLVVTLLAIMSQLLFKPILQVIESREQKTVARRNEADKLQQLGNEHLLAYQSRIRDARELSLKERDSLRESGRAAERKKLADVRSEIAQSINATREQVQRAETNAQSALTGEQDVLAKMIVARVLGREA